MYAENTKASEPIMVIGVSIILTYGAGKLSVGIHYLPVAFRQQVRADREDSQATSS